MAILNGGYNGDESDDVADTVEVEFTDTMARIITPPNSIVPEGSISKVTEDFTKSQYDVSGNTYGIGDLPTVDLDNTEN